jgi:site-specific recombinase XerC
LRDEFESGRAILTVLNWAERLTVQADLEEAGIKPGSVYEIRDAQNPLAPPLLRGSYSGGTVDIPMTMREVQQPIGHPNVTHTPIEFGVFMVRAIQS